MIMGILVLSFSIQNVTPTGFAASNITLLQISILTFIFGLLSFATACLCAIPALSEVSLPPQPQSQSGVYYPPQPAVPVQEYYQPQVTTRHYIAQRRQTLAEQEWVGVACPECGRNVSAEDYFCDLCGAQLKQVPELELGLHRESVEET
jgi:hypothetical protein